MDLSGSSQTSNEVGIEKREKAFYKAGANVGGIDDVQAMLDRAVAKYPLRAKLPSCPKQTV